MRWVADLLTIDAKMDSTNEASVSLWGWIGFVVTAAAVVFFLVSAATDEAPTAELTVADLNAVVALLSDNRTNPAKLVAAMHRVGTVTRKQKLEACGNQVWAQTTERMRESVGRSLADRNAASAEAELRRLLALRPPDDSDAVVWLRRDALFALATLELASGRREKSIKSIERALDMGANDGLLGANLLLLRSLALQIAGRTENAQRDRSAAIATYEKARRRLAP